jgi:hypothetical protein
MNSDGLMMVYGDHFLFGSRVRERGPFSPLLQMFILYQVVKNFSLLLCPFQFCKKKKFSSPVFSFEESYGHKEDKSGKMN